MTQNTNKLSKLDKAIGYGSLAALVLSTAGFIREYADNDKVVYAIGAFALLCAVNSILKLLSSK